MITLERASLQSVIRNAEFHGLSTDVKPLGTPNHPIRNGSIFYEIDTNKIYRFDAENAQWI